MNCVMSLAIENILKKNNHQKVCSSHKNVVYCIDVFLTSIRFFVFVFGQTEITEAPFGTYTGM